MSTNEIQLAYRPTIKRAYKIILAILAITELVIIRINVLEIMEETWYWGLIKLILASTVPVSIFYRMHFYLRPPIFSTYALFPDKLVIHLRKESWTVEFGQVVKVKLSKLPPRFMGGFTLKLASGHKFLFLSALKDNHVILQRVIQKRPELLHDEHLPRYLKASQLVEISWQRMRVKMAKWPIWTTKYIGWPLLAAAIAYGIGLRVDDDAAMMNQYLSLFLGAFTINTVLALALNFLEEWIVFRKIRGDEGEQISRDEKYEKQMENIVAVMFAILSLGSFVLFVYLYGTAA